MDIKRGSYLVKDWHQDAGLPTEDTGKIGDCYLDTTNDYVFVKSVGVDDAFDTADSLAQNRTYTGNDITTNKGMLLNAVSVKVMNDGNHQLRIRQGHGLTGAILYESAVINVTVGSGNVYTFELPTPILLDINVEYHVGWDRPSGHLWRENVVHDGTLWRADAYYNQADSFSGFTAAMGLISGAWFHGNVFLNPVDLTGQADGDYIRNDGGIYKPRTTGELVQDILKQDQWYEYSMSSDFDITAISGTGSVTYRSCRFVDMRTGTTSPSTAEVCTRQGFGFSDGQTPDRIQWANPVLLSIRISNITVSANAQRWVTLGNTLGDGPELARRGIGFRVDSAAIKGCAHDGTSLTVVDLTTAMDPTLVEWLYVYSDGLGNVSWYVNGVYKGTTAAGPVDRTAADGGRLWAAVHNNADTTDNRFRFHAAKVYIEQ